MRSKSLSVLHREVLVLVATAILNSVSSTNTLPIDVENNVGDVESSQIDTLSGVEEGTDPEGLSDRVVRPPPSVDLSRAFQDSEGGVEVFPTREEEAEAPPMDRLALADDLPNPPVKSGSEGISLRDAISDDHFFQFVYVAAKRKAWANAEKIVSEFMEKIESGDAHLKEEVESSEEFQSAINSAQEALSAANSSQTSIDEVPDVINEFFGSLSNGAELFQRYVKRPSLDQYNDFAEYIKTSPSIAMTRGSQALEYQIYHSAARILFDIARILRSTNAKDKEAVNQVEEMWNSFYTPIELDQLGQDAHRLKVLSMDWKSIKESEIVEHLFSEINREQMQERLDAFQRQMLANIKKIQKENLITDPTGAEGAEGGPRNMVPVDDDDDDDDEKEDGTVFRF